MNEHLEHFSELGPVGKQIELFKLIDLIERKTRLEISPEEAEALRSATIADNYYYNGGDPDRIAAVKSRQSELKRQDIDLERRRRSELVGSVLRLYGGFLQHSLLSDYMQALLKSDLALYMWQDDLAVDRRQKAKFMWMFNRYEIGDGGFYVRKVAFLKETLAIVRHIDGPNIDRGIWQRSYSKRFLG